MRVLSNLPFENLLVSETNQNVAQLSPLAMRTLIRDCGLCLTQDEMNRLKDYLKSPSLIPKNLASDILQRVPTIVGIENLDIDVLTYPKNSKTPLENALESDHFLKAHENRIRPAPAGEPALSIYGRAMLPYVKHAKSVTVIDNYAFQNLSYSSSGAYWFVQQTLGSSAAKITIHSSEIPDDIQAKDRASRNISSFNSRFNDRLIVKRYLPSSETRFPHDRYIQMKFNFDADICFDVAKGLETFHPTKVDNVRTFSPRTSADFSELLKDVRKCSFA